MNILFMFPEQHTKIIYRDNFEKIDVFLQTIKNENSLNLLIITVAKNYCLNLIVD